MKLHQAGARRSRVRATSWVWPAAFRLCTGSGWEGRTACDLTPQVTSRTPPTPNPHPERWNWKSQKS